MTDTLIRYLELIRNTCRDVQRTLDKPDQTASLGHAIALLNDILVQQGALIDLHDMAEQRFGALLAADAEPSSSAAQAVQAQLAAVGSFEEQTTVDLLRSATDVDLDYWRGYQAAIEAKAAFAQPLADTAAPADDIDTGVLREYIASVIPEEAGVEVLEARVVSRGFSKKTVLANLRGNRILPDGIALRIDQPFNYLGTTVVDEYPYLELLWKHGATIPQPFTIESSGNVLGQPFIISAKVGGGAIGGNYVAPPRSEALIENVAACLARIHSAPVDPVRGLQKQDGHKAHIDREIEAYYQDWRETGGGSAIVEAAFAWIRANRQAAYGPDAIIHNDYNFNNMMIEGDTVKAIVDWEFAHIGTPAADLGYFYYSAAAVSSFDQFLEHYRIAGGVVPSRAQLDFYIFWGQLRLVVMGFQMKSGLDGGNFKDIRFGAGLAHLRKGLLRVGEKLQELPTILG